MEHLNCLFCNIPVERIVCENELAYAVYDAFPVSEGHALIIPKRHITDFWDLTEQELLSCNSLLRAMKENILLQYSEVNGFNIGVNAGVSAGQTIFHCHIHLIPRRTGDHEDPRGGVRHILTGKGYY